MYILIIILSCLFLGIMIPTIMISIFRGTTVKLLEAFKFYEKGSLVTNERTIVTGAGYHRDAMVYLWKTAGGEEQFENGKVFGRLVLIFGTVFLISGLLSIVIMKLFLGF